MHNLLWCGEPVQKGKRLLRPPRKESTMALKDAFSRFLRGRAESQRNSNDDASGGTPSTTALDGLANEIDSDADPELVILVERLEGFYDPVTDEFVPTAAAVDVIEGFEGDDPRDLVKALGDSAPAVTDEGRDQGEQ
jgi:hypothetical protein